MLSMLPPREGRGPWRKADVHRAATRLVAARLVVTSACVAGVLVSVMTCGVMLWGRDEDADFLGPSPARSELWEVFQRVGIAEAFLTVALGSAVIAHALRASSSGGASKRALAGSIAAAAAHVPLWPISTHLVSLAIDWLHASAGLGAPGPDLDLGDFLCPVMLMCWPLGIAFGLTYTFVLRQLRGSLEPASGDSLVVARGISLCLGGLGLDAIALLAVVNGLEPYWIAAPALIVAAFFVVDLVMMLVLTQRTRRWLVALRTGRLPEWRLVEASAAHVSDDLAPLTATAGPQLALVRHRAGTYRDLPLAVALVPASSMVPALSADLLEETSPEPAER